MIEPFTETLLTCSTLADVQRAFGAAIAAEGFAIATGRAFFPRAKIQVHALFLNWPAEWEKTLSNERQFLASGPIVREARRRHMPFTWHELKSSGTFSPAENEIWAAISEWGWTDAFVVPIHGPSGYVAMLTMASRETKLDLTYAARMRLYTLAVVTHERCRALRNLIPAPDLQGALTVRELECLKWVADGQTDDRIGTILGISSDTVRFHVDNVRNKLGVRNRTQAVAQLCVAGLL
ncbi:LuxR family transcriptional regulator [Bosea sp. 685]|uniref:LuxR family transcriptional regulator n=1 Tax=Bosea sp. 685 TaxID=3080057 RepID=UPI00289329A9|nr:LuxR family transcriptional regulator [Bosea sp. 685]WNJ93547.1 LuxR family transcriptional regulator [Bosea sp. 685]